jgi:hypothetical protein
MRVGEVLGYGRACSFEGFSYGGWGVCDGGWVVFECCVGVGVLSGVSSMFMYLCHMECMIVEFGVGSFGSFLCSVSANWRKVALRVFNAV